MAKPLAVLIVEDSESDAQLIVRLLKKAGYNITFEQVENAAQMRAALEKPTWDVVISDYRLPEFDGHAALMLLQETGLDIPFIAVSGTMGEETAVDMMKAGAHDYVMKNNLARLVPAVERELIQAEVRRERRRAEEALRESESKFRGIVEQSSDGIILADEQGIIIEWNKSQEQITDIRRGDALGKSVWDILYQTLSEELKTAITYERFRTNSQSLLRLGEAPWLNQLQESVIQHSDGTCRSVQAVIFPIRTINGLMVASIVRDITERKRAEEALRESETRFRSLFENSLMGISTATLDGHLIEANLAYAQMYGYSDPDKMKDEVSDIGHQLYAHSEERQEVLQIIAEKGFMKPREMELVRRDGTRFFALVSARGVKDAGGKLLYYQANHIDITERKRAEEALRASEEKFRNTIQEASDGIVICDEQFRIVEWNKSQEAIFGLSRAKMVGTLLWDFQYNMLPEDKRNEEYYQRLKQVSLTVDQPENAAWMNRATEMQVVNAFGEIKTILFTPFVISTQRGSLYASLTTDITERKQAEIEIRQNLSELDVLYQSSLAFSQLIDSKTIAEKVIDLLDEEMAWHHTAIRLYHPESETLELLAFNLPYLDSREERGAAEERFKAIRNSDQGLSGWVVQHGQVVCSNDLRNDPRYFETFPGLQSGLYVPIKIGERVIGVISIESEQAQAFSESDERLVITLAAQAAIAMDNAQLFENLKRSNIDLALAYDATLEGWSRALDLRDKETEGHSQRVTDMTLRLAQSMGLSREELVHVRRGALLHDIGKLGVPDGILFKPGPLTPEEWVVMKKHPTFAYEMLAPIHYLQPALAIPHCHHEKWDGSGYPRGLIGPQIPLAARIFAVADVWDALKSDRPYRPGWTEEKVYEHIRCSAGTHFDPQVVDVFMQMPRNIPSTPVP